VKTIECDLCEKKFLTLNHMKRHKLSHTSIEVRKQTCPQCGVKVTKLKQHERIVHQKELHIPCTEKDCKTKFPTIYHLEKHIRSVHEKAKLACPHCDLILGRESLRSHIRIVHDKRRDHICMECKKTFQTKTHLNNHVSRVHRNIREKCPDCGKMVQYLKNHYRFVHLNVKNFPCEHCDSRFITNTALKEHCNTVHFYEHLECPECGDMVQNIVQHIQKAHGKRKKYNCSRCKKSFKYRTDLSKHITMDHLENKLKLSALGLMTSDDLLRNGRESNLQDTTTITRKLQLETKLEETCEVMDLHEDKPTVIDRLVKQKLSDGIGVLSCKEENKDIFSLHSEDQFYPPVEIVDTLHREDTIETVKLMFR